METPIKELVKDKEWQEVRQSLIGQWNMRPEWCCQQLRKYLGPINKTDKEIQITINNEFVAQNDILIAQKELEAQRVRNQKKVETTTAEKSAAIQFEAAASAAIKIRELEIQKILADARYKEAEAMNVAAGRWSGNHNGIIPQGSPFMFGLDSAKAVSK